jgi:hypothetical protein
MLGDLQAPVQECLAQTSEIFVFLEEDRELDGDLHTAVARIRSKYWGLYE